MDMLTYELQWLLYLLGDLGLDQNQPVPVFCDAKSAINIIENPIFHDRTKHIKIDCYIIRTKFLAGIIKPLGISTHKQLADLFTKSLGVVQGIGCPTGSYACTVPVVGGY